ncbi:hypothetical protein D910_11897 [Dendroctonus ponderosae]|uniref:Choline/carnitine acyltransferase domain-containing protein n=1 Tax=Dendroctonus ponderosae TaxID=77166 RepID=U4UWF2_DENPD|nr:hypothetical protein D910_11897 [Dendroctonus ponderosae]
MNFIRASIEISSAFSPVSKWKIPGKYLSTFQYPIDYEFIQRSPIPTMHFQYSLPHLPIPKLDLTCERYLAAQRPLLIDEAYRKAESTVNHFKTGTGKQLQTILKKTDRENRDSSYISDLWFDQSLRDRKPLPINYNPMLVMQNDWRHEYNNQLIRSTNLIISSVRFYKSLKFNLLEPEVYHLNPMRSNSDSFINICSSLPESLSWHGAYLFKAYPLDMSQYPSLFNSTRVPETDRDRLIKNLPGNHITVQSKGHFYAFSVMDQYGDILKPEKILARLKFIMEDDIENNEFPVGILTTLERNQWATLRHELGDNGNETGLKLIDSALFNVCLDDVSLDGDVYATIRNFLHGDGKNRWFDKSFSIQVSKDGMAAVNFEHSWGDGVATLRYVQDIYKDSTEHPFVHPNTAPYDDNISNVIRLDFHLTDKLKCSIEEAKADYKHYCRALDIDYLIFDRVGKNICKKQAVSPDAVMQLGFQKFLPLSLKAAHKKNLGQEKKCKVRLGAVSLASKHIAYVKKNQYCALRAFTLAINCKSLYQPTISELKMMIGDCSRHHNQLTREAAMGQGFDRHLFALKNISDQSNLYCNMFQDPYYVHLNHTILCTSTLSSPAVYAGGFGPAERNGLGVAYIIRDDELGVLVTSYPSYQNGSDFISALREAFAELVNILDKD